MKFKTAICYDECGDEVTMQVASIEHLPEEWTFRYWQEHTDRELAEWRLSLQDEDYWDLDY